MTCILEEPNWLPAVALERLGRAEPVMVGELSPAEVGELKAIAPELGTLLAESHPARAVTRNLFRLSRLASQRGDRQSLEPRWIWRSSGGRAPMEIETHFTENAPESSGTLPNRRSTTVNRWKQHITPHRQSTRSCSVRHLGISAMTVWRSTTTCYAIGRSLIYCTCIQVPKIGCPWSGPHRPPLFAESSSPLAWRWSGAATTLVGKSCWTS